MKHLYSTLLLLLVLSGGAQTLTQSFNEPVIGDRDRNYRIDTTALTGGLPLSLTGTNCIWNFMNLTGTFPIVVDSFKVPTAAPGASAYPGATFVQQRDVLYSYFKSTSNPQQTELLGGYSPSLTLTFTNSAIIAGYPVNYGYNLNDPVSGSFKYGTTTGACNGSITISADAVGTMNLPNGVTLNNVMRLKSVETLTLSLGIFPFGSFNQTIYNYYAPGKKFPVLSLNYTTYQLIAGTPTITAIIYGSDSYFTLVGVNNWEKNFEGPLLFPNPFGQNLQLSKEFTNEENEFLFYNQNGQLVLHTTQLPLKETETLAPGVYFAEVRNRSGIYRQRVIKE